MASIKTFSAKQVAEILGMHIDTVREHMRTGRIPAKRVGGQWRVTEEDLQNFLKAPDAHSEKTHEEQ